MKPGYRLALAGVLLWVAGLLSWRAVDQTQQSLVGTRTCEAARLADWDGALAASSALEGLSEHPPALRDAMMCRCIALEAKGEAEACHQLLDGWLLDSAAADWVPDAEHTTRWAASRAQLGRMGEAATVLERLRVQSPADPELTSRAFRLRLLADGRPETLAELESLAATLDGQAGTTARLVIAQARGERGEHAEQYALLAAFDPAPDDPLRVAYLLNRIVAAADAGNLEAAAAQRDAWIAIPGQMTNANLAYGVALSLAGARDPGGRSWDELLDPTAAVATDDDAVVRLAWERLIAQMSVEGRAEAALAALEKARVRFPTLAVDAEELKRLSGTDGLGRPGRDAGVSAVKFAVDHPVTGASLYVSPGRGRSPAGAWEQAAFSGPNAEVARALDATPVRWVYRSESTTFASGSVWPTTAHTEVAVTVRGEGTPRITSPDLRSGAPPDGHRRVWAVFLDCGDWRLTSYLRQRGELPTLDAILRTGWRATTLQTPAFTAAAVEGLMHPELRRSRSTLARINQLGLELAGLESIGQNPFAPIESLLPLHADLFQRLGRGDHRVANLIFAHGAIGGGRNASVTGPNGLEETLPLGSLKRPLTPAEAARFPELVSTAESAAAMRSMIGVIAAQFDTLRAFQDQPPFDLVLFRIEALDPLTHQYFAETTRGGQDDGAPRLFDTYRYIDARLGEFARNLDGDDMLIVMSDHGIETSMVHDPIAMFVAWGSGVPSGRVTGSPALRGLSRGLADLLGEETAWPDYGLVPWAEQWRAGESVNLAQSAALNPEASP